MRKFLLKSNILLFIVLLAGIVLFAVKPASAACDPGTEQQVSIGFPGAVLKGDTYCVPLNKGNTNIASNPIFIMLKGFAQFLAAGVGIAVVGGIVYGGIVYMTARANPGQIQKAEEIIRSAVIGLLLYIFMFAILNFLIPGGILS